jgi:type II secretory pathway pseudopilin PulG
MAIVLVIVTILIGGLAMPLAAQIQARRIAETQKTLEEAREAVLGFAMTTPATTPTKRRLPCPDTDGNGTQNLDGAGNCVAANGWLPWVDLGVAAQDAWGNRLRYAVTSPLADTSLGFPDGTTHPPQPLVICSTHTCSPVSPDVANDLAFVLVSLGPDGWGALNVNGNTLASPTSADEQDNLDANRIYINRASTKPGAASGEFDDLLMWVSYSQLIARVCPSGSGCSP